MKKIIAGILFLIAVLVIAPKFIKPKDLHFHAGFQVYVDDKLQDFSDNKYMDETPCTKNGKPLPDVKVDDQLEKAHMHDHKGYIVHVHRKGSNWSDLF